MYKYLFLFFLMLSGVVARAQHTTGVWDVYQLGAKGDGKTMDTQAIQSAIDQCHQAGGGKVYLHNGTFLSGTIYLKSNVTLYVEAGATLLGSANVDDYPIIPSKYPSYTGELVTNKMLIYAEDARAISIQGRGTIDGRGDDFDGPYLSPSFSGRPRIIHFRNCENVQVRDVTLYNSGSWVQSYQSCKNMLIDGITVDSRENKDIEKPRYATVRGRNTDGLDLVDCERVRISNCFINSGDDAICLKSFSPGEACRDITITNCIVSSNASGIKIGTETSGAFEDITIQNCVVYDTRVDAISIMTVDGARVERINVSNITVRNIKGAAIFIRLGARNRPYRKDAKINAPILRDVRVDNVQGTRIGGFGCSVTGLPGMKVENVVLSRINLEFTGGNFPLDVDKSTVASTSAPLTQAAILQEINREVPENVKAYPRGEMFGRLPAYGFYIRHVKNITLDQVQLRFAQDDHRPALICDDVEGLELSGLQAQGTSATPALLRLVNVQNAVISGSRPIFEVPLFLSVQGKESKGIVLQNNVLKNAKQKVVAEKGAQKSVVVEL
ncbi:polygalacturonase [Rhabdobacter roseus]|uniref:Polygalacturonase n=1 Tax=Rhabdobacter roseus TaxID=1655419 RepID=A0A840U0Y9_9BACT|nr:glycoside hydrolase family 28 protein [Rhabdobacter roseus]MBB5287243.1 polygalacturonase [Rhabdobacter roseus]